MALASNSPFDRTPSGSSSSGSSGSSSSISAATSGGGGSLAGYVRQRRLGSGLIVTAEFERENYRLQDGGLSPEQAFAVQMGRLGGQVAETNPKTGVPTAYRLPESIDGDNVLKVPKIERADSALMRMAQMIPGVTKIVDSSGAVRGSVVDKALLVTGQVFPQVGVATGVIEAAAKLVREDNASAVTGTLFNVIAAGAAAEAMDIPSQYRGLVLKRELALSLTAEGQQRGDLTPEKSVAAEAMDIPSQFPGLVLKRDLALSLIAEGQQRGDLTPQESVALLAEYDRAAAILGGYGVPDVETPRLADEALTAPPSADPNRPNSGTTQDTSSGAGTPGLDLTDPGRIEAPPQSDEVPRPPSARETGDMANEAGWEPRTDDSWDTDSVTPPPGTDLSNDPAAPRDLSGDLSGDEETGSGGTGVPDAGQGNDPEADGGQSPSALPATSGPFTGPLDLSQTSALDPAGYWTNVAAWFGRDFPWPGLDSPENSSAREDRRGQILGAYVSAGYPDPASYRNSLLEEFKPDDPPPAPEPELDDPGPIVPPEPEADEDDRSGSDTGPKYGSAGRGAPKPTFLPSPGGIPTIGGGSRSYGGLKGLPKPGDLYRNLDPGLFPADGTDPMVDLCFRLTDIFAQQAIVAELSNQEIGWVQAIGAVLYDGADPATASADWTALSFRLTDIFAHQAVVADLTPGQIELVTAIGAAMYDAPNDEQPDETPPELLGNENVRVGDNTPERFILPDLPPSNLLGNENVRVGDNPPERAIPPELPRKLGTPGLPMGNENFFVGENPPERFILPDLPPSNLLGNENSFVGENPPLGTIPLELPPSFGGPVTGTVIFQPGPENNWGAPYTDRPFDYAPQGSSISTH